MPPKSPGFTLLEVLLAIVLTTICLAGLLQASERGLALVKETTTVGEIDVRTSRALSRIAHELMVADGSTLAPDLSAPLVGPNTGFSAITFRQVQGYEAGAKVWGDPMELHWEMATGEIDNGVDDDGDGLVDEGCVVLVHDQGLPDEQRVVLANDVCELQQGETSNGADDNGNGLVDECGFCLSRDGDVITLRLSLERLGPDQRTIVRTQQTSFLLRNP